MVYNHRYRGVPGHLRALRPHAAPPVPPAAAAEPGEARRLGRKKGENMGRFRRFVGDDGIFVMGFLLISRGVLGIS